MSENIYLNATIPGHSLKDLKQKKKYEHQLSEKFNKRDIHLEQREFIEDIGIHIYNSYILIQIPISKDFTLSELLKLLNELDLKGFSYPSLLDSYSEEEKKKAKLRHLPLR